jgi:hypothetical protein
MKKIIIGLSGIVLVALVVVLFTNATSGNPKDTKKAQTEVSKDCGKCPAAASCAKSEAKTEAKACPNATEACKTKACPAATAEAKKCDEAKPCCAAKK